MINGMPRPARSTALPDMQARVLAASITAETLGSGNPYLRILAEFLLVAAPTGERRWWVSTVDPEPGPEVARLFDGRCHHVRMDDGTWQRQIGPDDAAEPAGCRWEEFGDRILVDATQPHAGTYKINNPSPGGPVADWQSTTPGEAAIMIEQTLQLLRDRIGEGDTAGVIATRWTPTEHGPILMVSLGPTSTATDGDQGELD